jgi:hypothetical protein
MRSTLSARALRSSATCSTVIGLHVARQGAKGFGMLGAAQQVQQGFVVVLAGGPQRGQSQLSSRSKSATTKRSASSASPTSSSITPGCCNR